MAKQFPSTVALAGATVIFLILCGIARGAPRGSLGAEIESASVRSVDVEIDHYGGVVLPQFEVEVAIFVIDTSGSMRAVSSNLLRSEVRERVLAQLIGLRGVRHLVMLDGSGHEIAKWDAGKRSEDGETWRREIVDLVLRLAHYPGESVSSPLEGLTIALERADRHFASLQSRIFVFGDEYTGEFKGEFSRLLNRKLPPINVYRAHERSNSTVGTFRKFEIFAGALAEASGGSYFRFVPSEFGQTPQAILLGRLALDFPGEKWAIEEDPGSVAKWNRLLQAEFRTDRDFLVAWKQDGPQAATKVVTIKAPESRDGAGHYYVELRALDESKAREYLVALRRAEGGLQLYHWQLLWEME